MKRRLSCLIVAAVVLIVPALRCAARDAAAEAFKKHERYTVSLELEFTRRNPNALDKMMTFLDMGPNGYATGFMVGDGLVMTAYHVVSGEVGQYKKMAMGYSAMDQLDVK